MMKVQSYTGIFFLSLLFVKVNGQSEKNSYNNPSKIKVSTMATGNYAEVNGIKMYYEIHGEGKPLVLVHGGGSTIETTFGRILPLLAQYYKVIAVEMQAHGHTSDRNAPETFEQDADDIAALLKHLNISKAYILGFSNGGSTTLQVAIRYPEMVDKIVVASAAYRRDGFIPGFFDMMQNATLENMPQPLKDAFLKINPDTAALLNMHDKDANRMRTFKDWDDNSLKSIKVPALIMNADKDVITNEHAVRLSRLIPDAQLVILPGVHGTFLGEICTAVPGSKLPEMTVQLIKEFLNN